MIGSADPLLVVMDGRVVGDITTHRSGGRLLYDTSATTPLSISMPLSSRRHRSAVLTPWLRGLLPDRDSVLMQWRRAFGVRSLNPIELLRHVGEEVAGSAQFVRPDRLGEATTYRPARPLTDREIGDMFRRAISAAPESDDVTRTGRFSLAGMQPKIALQKQDDGQWALPEGANPTTHVLKPAIPGLSDQHLNEYLTMTAARLAGIAVATSAVETIDPWRGTCSCRRNGSRTSSVGRRPCSRTPSLRPRSSWVQQSAIRGYRSGLPI